MRRLALIFAALGFLVGCAEDVVWAPDEAVQRAAYRFDGPPSITVYTVINVGSDNGAHSGLLINASQRVIFDPAGSFVVNIVPERHDVLYGITEQIRVFYEFFHARSTYYVIAQEIEVTPEVAEIALRTVEGYGAVPKAMCANAVSTVLAEIPGFDEKIKRTFSPTRIMEAVATMEGVQTRRIEDDDADDKSLVLQEFQAAINRSIQEKALAAEQVE